MSNINIMYIYKLRHKSDINDQNIYVGYTKDLKKRMTKHKNKCWEAPNRKIYKYVTENGGWNNFEMIVLCNCDNTNKRILEQHFIDELRPTLNTIRSISLNSLEETN